MIKLKEDQQKEVEAISEWFKEAVCPHSVTGASSLHHRLAQVHCSAV